MRGGPQACRSTVCLPLPNQCVSALRRPSQYHIQRVLPVYAVLHASVHVQE